MLQSLTIALDWFGIAPARAVRPDASPTRSLHDRPMMSLCCTGRLHTDASTNVNVTCALSGAHAAAIRPLSQNERLYGGTELEVGLQS